MTSTYHLPPREETQLPIESPESDLLTINEIADILGVNPTTARRWAKDGALEVVTLPHTSKRQSYRVRRATLNKILTPIRMEAK